MCRNLQIFVLHQFLHVDDNEEFLQVKLTLSHIVAIEAYKIGISNVDATLRQHPFLIGNVWSVLFEFRLLTFKLRETAALYLIDSPSARRLSQYINGTIIVVESE